MLMLLLLLLLLTAIIKCGHFWNVTIFIFLTVCYSLKLSTCDAHHVPVHSFFSVFLLLLRSLFGVLFVRFHCIFRFSTVCELVYSMNQSHLCPFRLRFLFFLTSTNRFGFYCFVILCCCSHILACHVLYSNVEFSLSLSLVNTLTVPNLVCNFCIEFETNIVHYSCNLSFIWLEHQ